uniref:Uncharacterized protein n=1 Tax=Setaria digitata TaxID=48799 RepID=A0A915PI75_9BILA
MYFLGLIAFASFGIVTTGEILKCNDITTRRAIEKREREINLKCIEKKKQLERCNNHTAVDIAWNKFEQDNENYFTILDSCKEQRRAKRLCECSNKNCPACRYKRNSFGDHDPDRYGTKETGKRLNEKKMKRSVHGSSDDKKNQKTENDYSSDFLRFKRYECLKDGEREKNRLHEKFKGLCKPDAVFERDRMNKSCKDNVAKLSRTRQKAYINYVTAFQLCYGPIS